MYSRFLTALPLAVSLVAATPHGGWPTSTSSAAPIATEATCNGKNYVYNQLAGYGYVPSRSYDKYGDTLGGFGSAAAIDQSSWKKVSSDTYEGIMWATPDRGWNTNGTLNYQNRVHKLAIKLKLAPQATANNSAAPNLKLTYLDTILFSDWSFNPTTGLDADVTGPYLKFPGGPDVPSAKYTGDGFGGNGKGGNRVTVDSEGLVLGAGGTFWVSDEYGPYIYQFSPKGQMISVIRPPEAIIPRRNTTESFSADSPPIYNPDEVINPEDTTTGRNNNQGLEGLTVSTDGKRLYALMQSALDQEGGPDNPYRRPARFLVYDISNAHSPRYLHEYIVMLPLTPSGKKVAAQSEVHYISDTQFMILARDSGNGRGQGDNGTSDNTESKYRHIDVFDISAATDIKGTYDAANSSIASSEGVLISGVTPATYCPFLDFNNNTELARFGVHNGGLQDSTLLNEKWESIALVPVNPSNPKSKEYFIFSLSDNDFITQKGKMNFGRFSYADETGFDLDNQALVFQVTLP